MRGHVTIELVADDDTPLVGVDRFEMVMSSSDAERNFLKGAGELDRMVREAQEALALQFSDVAKQFEQDGSQEPSHRGGRRR